MYLDPRTIYTESPHDQSNRPASPEPRDSEIRDPALATWFGVESAYGSDLRGPCLDEAAALRRGGLCGTGRHGHLLSETSGNQVLRHARRPVLPGRRKRARAKAAQHPGLLPPPPWTY